MPISGNVTAFVGRLYQTNGNDIFILWNFAYRKLIVVEVVGLRLADFDHNDQEYNKSITRTYLGKIQEHLETVDFESDDVWAYLIPPASGRPSRIIQRPRQHYRIPCDFLWAPRVDISEIDTYNFWCGSGQGLGRGVWQGKKVDFHIGCDDGGLQLVERETRGAKAVRGMDISYDVIAHVFRGDLLIGIMTEPCQASRPIRWSDRAAVFAAFARLERAFMLHGFLIDELRILIDEKGRVRILDLYNLEYYARHKRQKLEEDAQELHWDRLNLLFEGLALPLNRTAVSPLRLWYPASTILARTPAPERRLLVHIIIDLPVYTVQPAKDEKKSRHRKPSDKGTPKTITIGTVSLGPKARELAVSNLLRSIQPPPPYTESALPHERPGFRRLLLAPSPEDGGASIVEV
ncbi:hypothetical protein DFH07DRAFT_849209 [Mycena maculata]|uniref:Uncharacterized protein n=1 Tax=Mycena maculata TaxID=230809 RepID=A0AAD7MTQ2_9AGAR|nr:hypothetical protein DFH07DRAFT_849209 [Mycena maculata]